MLVVFDLDFTIWDAGGTWCDHTRGPYVRSNGYIEDADGRIITLYPEVKEILDFLSGKGISMAIASRTHNPETARLLMKLFGIHNYFRHEEIYPGSKLQHFISLKKITKLPYQKMIFFDDEYRNIEEVSSLGVHAKLVKSGVNWKELRALDTFLQNPD